MRKAEVFYNNEPAGIVTENDEGYYFHYYDAYLESEGAAAVSLTLPLSSKVYENPKLFPFFDGLIPEGWMLAIAEKNWKIDSRDRMGLLLTCCRDCIGAVSVRPIDE